MRGGLAQATPRRVCADHQPSAMTTADATPASCDRDRWKESTPRSLAAREDGAADLERGRPSSLRHDPRVGPVQADGSAERLGERLLGRKPRGERGDAEVTLLVGEEPFAQRRGALEGLPETLDVDDVDPDTVRSRPLDRDRLGEVARLVDVEALGRRQLQREDLQRDHA
jgi:hypothetical protein